MNCFDRPHLAGCTLSELLPELVASRHGELRISGISIDSRSVRPGDAFIALRGAQHDGMAFLAQAARSGAAVALVDASVDLDAPVVGTAITVVAVADLAARVSSMAGRFYGNPSVALDVIGVTGTNGKTTCTQLIAQAFGLLGKSCGVVGTLGWGFPAQLAESTHTTPDAVTTQRVLATLREQGAAYAALEVSSHALKQGRVAGVQITTAVFTNLTHDHLDYHGTLEDYGASKKLLFQGAELQHAVINVDDAYAPRILAALPGRIDSVSYGIGDGNAAMVRALEPIFTEHGMRARVVTPWGSGELSIPLLGRFNLSNALAVLSVLCVHGVALADALAALARLVPVRGRMERIESSGGPLVIVDYAHTPDALEQTLRALRQHCRGRLWCVFGCGGDRDRAKRPLMGRIAWENADELILTSDNPRGEDPERIVAEIASGIPLQVRREIDRAHAIGMAIEEASPGDCVLIAGKGHEDYQETGGTRVSFSDTLQARLALAARDGRA